ncbi:MAG: GtrA family protein [Gallionella sp.]|jgi:dolichol-phosphate mannosyltransferase|nr:GtrA family protein [Gallionella sp.]
MSLFTRLSQQPLLAWVFKRRFMKFGTVGASGVVVNLAVLYVCQEFVFRAIEPANMRLNVSLAAAIFFATVNNFYWNRAWTWRDRQHHRDKHLLLHFGQYALAVWVGIVLQVILTKLLVLHLHYLIANASAIVLASVFNFLVNNFWTFRHHKPADEMALPNIPELDDEAVKK